MNWRRILKPLVPAKFLEIRKMFIGLKPATKRQCPLCGYHGFFSHFGRPPRLDALCPNCECVERHRLFWLWFDGDVDRLKEPLVHFAPEKVLEQRFRQLYSDYKTADLFYPADLTINIEDINLPDESFETVICNHVLEHVDDRKALKEICRILSPTGILVVSVPIIEGWDKTYEDESITDPAERELHFGQSDHVRYYGRDFRDRLSVAGFSRVEEVTAQGGDVVKYALGRGNKFFLCSKA